MTTDPNFPHWSTSSEPQPVPTDKRRGKRRRELAFERKKTSVDHASNYLRREGVFRCQCEIRPGVHPDQPPRSDRPRRADRNPLLRHLPLRSSLRSATSGASHAHGLPVRPRPRDRRPCHQGRLRGHEVQARRPRGGRLHGRFGRHLPPVPSAASSSSART